MFKPYRISRKSGAGSALRWLRSLLACSAGKEMVALKTERRFTIIVRFDLRPPESEVEPLFCNPRKRNGGFCLIVQFTALGLQSRCRENIKCKVHR